MITYEEMQARLFRAENTIKEQEIFIIQLSNALQWYVDNDDVYEGGKWEEENAYWIGGKRTALEILTEVQQFYFDQQGESI